MFRRRTTFSAIRRSGRCTISSASIRRMDSRLQEEERRVARVRTPEWISTASIFRNTLQAEEVREAADGGRIQGPEQADSATFSRSSLAVAVVRKRRPN